MAEARSRAVAVLGAGGFLGSHITEALLDAGYSVEAVDLSLDKLEVEHALLHRHVRDIRDRDFVDALVQRCGTVLSLTAICRPAEYTTNPLAVIRASYDDVVPVVEAATRAGSRLIHTSTCEVYGRSAVGLDGRPMATMSEADTALSLGPVPFERWTYASAKQLLERVIWAHGQHAGLSFTVIRPFNVIGPRMDFIPGVDGEGVPRVVASFMHALIKGVDLPLVDGGGQRRAFMDVTDFVAAIIRVLERVEACDGQILNIGAPDNEISIAALAADMIRLYRQLTGDCDSGTSIISGEAFYGDGYDDSVARIPDITRARELLDWVPRVGLDEALAVVVRDYTRRYGQVRQQGAG